MGIFEEMQAQLNRIEGYLRKCGLGDEVDQTRSPLGRRHCAVVRGLIAKGDPRAYKRGKRHVLTREALEEVMRSEQRAANDALPSAVEEDAFYQQMLAETNEQ